MVTHEGKGLFYKLRTPVLKNAWKNTAYFHGSLIEFSTTKFNTRSLIALLAMCDPCVPVGVSYSTLIYLPAVSANDMTGILWISTTHHITGAGPHFTLKAWYFIPANGGMRRYLCCDVQFIRQVGLNYLIRLCMSALVDFSLVPFGVFCNSMINSIIA